MSLSLWLNFIFLMVVRAGLGAWLVTWAFFKWNPTRYKHFRIQTPIPTDAQFTREKHNTWMGMPIDFAVLACMYWLTTHGYTKIYWEIEENGWTYWIASVVILALLQDFYFYLTHRLLHTKFLMKHVHRVHHASPNPTPWSSFNVHPVEKVIELLFFPAVIVALPLHPGALIAYSYFSAFSNLMGHSGYEFSRLPKLMLKPYWIGATSSFHNAHHEFFEGNFSLYLSLWDKVFRTEHPKYGVRLLASVERRRASGF